MHGTPARLSHETLVQSLASAHDASERDALLDEVRRRLQAAPEPRERSHPWSAENGGC